MTLSTYQPGSTFAGEFTVVSLLGEGAMGQVYLVEQKSTGKRRALKLMRPELLLDPTLKQRFEQEARVGARIASEHVVDVVDAGIDAISGTPWIAMELLEGEHLGAWRAQHAQLSIDDARNLLEQLCHALGAAHDAGIVHRDLKPQNVFVCKSLHAGTPFTVKVLDFGIAKLVDEAAAKQTAAVGTPLWMAPEQTQASFGISPATDVWALGLLTFWLLTGKYYWREANAASPTATAILREVVSEPIVAASARAREYGCESRLPPGFDPWFARCVARESSARYPHAREAFKGLETLLRTGEAPAVGAGVFGAGPVGGSPFGAPSAGGPAAQPSGGAFGTPLGPPPGTFGQPATAAPPWGQVPPPPPPKSGQGAVVAIVAVVAVVAVLGLIVAGAAGAFLVYRGSAAPLPPAPVAVRPAAALGPVPVDADDAVWGNANAMVTLVVFGEYQCPYCSRLDRTLDQIKSKYGSQDVRIVWKHFPLDFHKQARSAAIAAATVRSLGGNDAYWRFHEQALSNQKDLTDENFERWAASAGVDARAFRNALAARTHEAAVDDDIALGKRIGVRGTPATFVNGELVSGARSFDDFAKIIDEQLREARAEIAAGTPSDRVYEVLSERNYEKPAETDKKKRDKVDDSVVWKVPVGDSPVRGSRDALVTIVLFSEYQCPFCKRIEPTLDEVREHYGSEVRVVWKDRPLPFHKQAVPAARFAREARRQKGDAGFWAAHDLLFDNNTRLTESDLIGYAGRLGLDGAAVRRALAAGHHQKAIDADGDLADALGAKGTPTCFVNGRQLRGAQPFDKFKSMIDEELRKARSLVASGTPRSAVYDKIMAGARQPGTDDAGERVDVGEPTADHPSKGAPNAPIVVQVFADFQCPFCARVAPTLDRLVEANPGKVRIVWRHLPLAMHADAMLAAEASVEVYEQKGNEGFWAFHDLLLKNQKSLSRVDLEGYAERVGVDLASFRAALDDHRHRAFVEREAAVAKSAGITGTPTSVVNGELVKGAQPYDKFRRVVERLAK